MKEFVPNSLGLQILTPTGYQNFAGVAYMGDKPIVRLAFGNRKTLNCTADHRLITTEGLLAASELRIGSSVFCRGGKTTRLKERIYTNEVVPVYDIIQAGDDHEFLANGLAVKNCSFVSDDDTLIDSLRLARMTSQNPEFYTDQVRWYMYPKPNRTYLVALDPSVGVGSDYAAIQVFMLPEMIQVAEWQHNRTVARGQVMVLMQILLFIDATLRDSEEQSGEPDLYWTVENNTIGEAVLGIIEDTGEDRFPGSFVSEKKRKGQTRRFRKGMNTDNRKKLSACARLKSLVESDRMTIHSQQLIRELKNFVKKESSFGAKSGEFDDLVMAAILIVRMLDVVLGWGTNGGDLREYIADDELFEQEPMPVALL